MTKNIDGLSGVFGLYDGFILDLWGVVHDGIALLPGALPALTQLKKAKRKVWLLSNAPRRVSVVTARLAKMGITPDLYDGLMTSGEASHDALRDTLLERWGRRCFHIGASQHDGSLYEDLSITLVKTPEEADFVLNSGVGDFSDSSEIYWPVLQKSADLGLPMLCANPDKIVHIENRIVICAGTFADTYEKMGGAVTSIGKPYRGVYSHCLKAMGDDTRVLAVGDSMLTDIQGATGAGLDSLLITSGIHREEVHSLVDFLAGYPYKPTYVAKSFRW
jgi:HAD superfamily hydrolase (TIGR01459 family)